MPIAHETPVDIAPCSIVVNSSGDGRLRLNIAAQDLDGNPAPDCVIAASPDEARALVAALVTEIGNAQDP